MTDILAGKRSQAARMLGLGAYRPSRVVPNSELVDAIDSTDEWIQQRTGIKTRRFAEPNETLLSMSVEASKEALKNAEIDASQIDAVILATISHYTQTPALAPAIATELGAVQPVAFDISAACAGFCTGLALARDMVIGGSATHVLVIGAERLSDITSPTDRSTAFIFADGAGAAVVGPADVDGIGPVIWGSDGEHADLVKQNVDWFEALASGGDDKPHLVQEGAAVFRWASYDMAKVAQQALDAAGVTADDLDVFVPHQANNRIIDALVRATKLPDTVRIARDIIDQGNTSAASVPLALDRLLAEGHAKSGDLALLIGFGAGLAYAAQVVRVP